MYERAWKWLVFYGFSLVFLILTLVVIRWAVDFVTWAPLDSGWAQALGSVLAIGVAFWIGAKQSRDAIQAVVFGYDHATRRRYQAYSVIVQATKDHCILTLDCFPDGSFGGLHLLLAQLDKKRSGLRAALDAIPIHDVGTYGAVESLVALRITMEHLDNAIGRANAHLDSFGCEVPFNVPFDTGVIRGNSEAAIVQAGVLMNALLSPFGELENTASVASRTN